MRHEMGEPRITREALIAQMLGELDGLLTRAERLPKTIADAERRVAMTARILDEAGNRYRQAVTAFTDEAKTMLTDYLQHKAVETVTFDHSEQYAALEEVVRRVLHAEAALRASSQDTGSNPAAAPRRRPGIRLLGHAATALFASALTALVLSATRLI